MIDGGLKIVRDTAGGSPAGLRSALKLRGDGALTVEGSSRCLATNRVGNSTRAKVVRSECMDSASQKVVQCLHICAFVCGDTASVFLAPMQWTYDHAMGLIRNIDSVR